MENVSRFRAFSSPSLMPFPETVPASSGHAEGHNFEGMATNVKLLLKLIQDHNEACNRDSDDRKPQRIAGMMTILDDVKSRIQKSHSGKKRFAELRRCNTDLKLDRTANDTKDKKPAEQTSADEKEKLRKQLDASMAARKSLEIMCSSLGKEKEIMATELAKKAYEMNEMEELVNDLKAQNQTLLAKLKACAVEQKEKKSNGGEGLGNAALHERNKALSEQLLKSLDGYRSLKRRYRAAKEENMEISATMEEIGTEVGAGLERIRSFRQRMITSHDRPEDIEEEISALEQMFEQFNTKISKQGDNIIEFEKPKAKINARKPPVLV